MGPGEPSAAPSWILWVSAWMLRLVHIRTVAYYKQSMYLVRNTQSKCRGIACLVIQVPKTKPETFSWTAWLMCGEAVITNRGGAGTHIGRVLGAIDTSPRTRILPHMCIRAV